MVIVREIILVADRGTALVDDADYDALSQFKWFRHSYGYACYRRGTVKHGTYRTFLMHRVILDAADGQYVDHIDGNPLNNQRSNLRLCTQSENMGNTSARGGSSKYKGVQRPANSITWVAKIGHQGKYYHLGSFQSEVDAALAYNEAAIRLFGEFARLNVIDEGMCGV